MKVVLFSKFKLLTLLLMGPKIGVIKPVKTLSVDDSLAIWEQVNNRDFNRMGFHTVRNGEGRLLNEAQSIMISYSFTRFLHNNRNSQSLS